MRGCAIVIKLRRSGGINTGKDNFFCTFTNIQGVAVTDFIALTIDSNRTGGGQGVALTIERDE